MCQDGPIVMTTTPGRGLVRWRLALSGACEPEAVLDKSWFTNAASRAMMIGSRWYDRAMPDEKVIGKDGMNRIINLLGKYAKTRWITITVEDLDGTPAAGAKVRLR